MAHGDVGVGLRGAVRAERLGHLPALDGVRGIAILGVLGYHFAYWASLHVLDAAHTPYFRMAGFGAYGVTLFFVLSGFLITRILRATRDDPNHWSSFYVRRILRIFPLYYALLAGYFGILPLLTRYAPPEADGAAWYWLYLANWRIASHGWSPGMLNHLWTLGIEEQFYLVWPLVVFRVNRRTILWLALAGIALCPIARAALELRVAAPGVVVTAPYVLRTPYHLDALLWGCFLAVAGENGGLAYQGAPDLPWLIFGRTVVTVLSAVLVGCAAAAATGGSLMTRALGWRPLRFFGKYSYGLYMVHYPIGCCMAIRGWTNIARLPAIAGSRAPAALVLLAFGTTVSLIVALLSWRLLESPMLQLKRYFEYGNDATARNVSRAPE